jgi:hypothetical protein
MIAGNQSQGASFRTIKVLFAQVLNLVSRMMGRYSENRGGTFSALPVFVEVMA